MNTEEFASHLVGFLMIQEFDWHYSDNEDSSINEAALKSTIINFLNWYITQQENKVQIS